MTDFNVIAKDEEFIIRTDKNPTVDDVILYEDRCYVVHTRIAYNLFVKRAGQLVEA